MARAQAVLTAAGAIGTIYAAVLGLVFTTSNSAKFVMLPPRGLATSFFLAAAIVLAAIYLAFITHS